MITILEGIQQDIREVKQTLREMKSKRENSSEYECIIENPFDELQAFGFKAKSLEEVSGLYSYMYIFIQTYYSKKKKEEELKYVLFSYNSVQ